MSDILSFDFNLLKSSLTDEEVQLLNEYQALAVNLNSLKDKLEDINRKISSVSDTNIENLTELSTDLQKSVGILSTVYKSTVHNVLLQVDSNQMESSETSNDQQNSSNNVNENIANFAKSQISNSLKNQLNESSKNEQHSIENNNIENNLDEDVDLDEEAMETVNRINQEFSLSNEDVDIHRQIADQLESNNDNQ